MAKSTQWNPNRIWQADREIVYTENGRAESYITEHPLIRHTYYSEVSSILGTSGCSRHKPYWDNSVMGVIKLDYGKLFINPGQWLNEYDNGTVTITDEPIFPVEVV